jgi:acetyl-CoA carboxylase carboxyltransferase component
MVTDDGIIDPRDTRTILGFCLSVVNNIPIEGANEYGVYRL